MKTLFQKLKSFSVRIAGFIPTALPVGMQEFEAWSDSIINAYNLPGTVRDKKYMLASMIIRFGETTAYKSKFFFYLAIRSAAAKQIAGAKFTAIREERNAEIAAEEAANKAAVTAPTLVVPNASKV